MPATVTSNRFDGTVFLDRDGTINLKAPARDYVTSPDALVLLPGAAEAIRALNEANFRVLVVTNQRGIALGKMTEQDLAAVHGRLAELLADHGARIDAIYHCPHAEGCCNCRKPKVGLFQQAAAEHPDLRLEHCALFGDTNRDMAAGLALGMTRVLIAEDQPAGGRAEAIPIAHHTAPRLLDGVEWFLARTAAWHVRRGKRYGQVRAR